LRLLVTDNRQPGERTQTKITANGLAERAERLGGKCTVASRPGGGTTIEWVVPTHRGGNDQKPATKNG
jgi:signal transduction histidine kinase